MWSTTAVAGRSSCSGEESVGGFPAPTLGYCAAKDEHYFGFKGGLRITDYGLIVHAPLLPAYGHDSTVCDPLLAGLQAPTQVIGDAAFIGLDRQQQLQQHHIHLLTPLKRNMRPTQTRIECHGALGGVSKEAVGRLLRVSGQAGRKPIPVPSSASTGPIGCVTHERGAKPCAFRVGRIGMMRSVGLARCATIFITPSVR